MTVHAYGTTGRLPIVVTAAIGAVPDRVCQA